MNKIPLLSYRCSLLALALCLVALACFHPPAVLAEPKPATAAAAKSQEMGRLVIVRAANLGVAVVGISIDGKEVTKLNFGGRYDAPLSAGPHTLASIPIPDMEHGGATERKITVDPGKTYTFTAKRDDVRIILK